MKNVITIIAYFLCIIIACQIANYFYILINNPTYENTIALISALIGIVGALIALKFINRIKE